jgi:hypothetical protein
MVPTALIGIIRPSATSDWRVIWFLTIIVYTMPEIVAWLILFKEPAKEYFDRLKWAQTEINQIRESFGDIADSVIDIFNKVKNWPDQASINTSNSVTELTTAQISPESSQLTEWKIAQTEQTPENWQNGEKSV